MWRARARAVPSCCAATSSVTKLLDDIATMAGAERGIFGMPEENRNALEDSIQAVEALAPSNPTAHNARVTAGAWRLVYTTLIVLGRRRARLAIATGTKSGLVSLGEFIQTVDADAGHTANIVHFSVMGMTSGTFTVRATYDVVSDRRVNVVMTGTELEPQKLRKLLGENEGLLLQIFNPEGFLDLTYVDESIRIGRDDKEQVFVLKKIEDVA